MKISIEVGVKAPARWQKMINGVKLRFLLQSSWVIGIEDCFRTRSDIWLASQQPALASPSLIINIIIIVMVVKSLIINSISTTHLNQFETGLFTISIHQSITACRFSVFRFLR